MPDLPCNLNRSIGAGIDHIGDENMKLLLCLIGLVLIVEGLPYFAFPDKMKKWSATMQEMPDSHLRIMGFVAMAVGLLIAYIFRN